jgi:hypothetical protein
MPVAGVTSPLDSVGSVKRILSTRALLANNFGALLWRPGYNKPLSPVCQRVAVKNFSFEFAGPPRFETARAFYSRMDYRVANAPDASLIKKLLLLGSPLGFDLAA